MYDWTTADIFYNSNANCGRNTFAFQEFYFCRQTFAKLGLSKLNYTESWFYECKVQTMTVINCRFKREWGSTIVCQHMGLIHSVVKCKQWCRAKQPVSSFSQSKIHNSEHPPTWVVGIHFSMCDFISVYCVIITRHFAVPTTCWGVQLQIKGAKQTSCSSWKFATSPGWTS